MEIILRYGMRSQGAPARRIRANTTPPRETHSLTRPAPEESPERRQCRFHIRLFGAVWGAQPPTYSPRKAFQSQCDRAKAHKRRNHAPTQSRRSVKRVQRVEDSLAQSGARSPSVLPAEKLTMPMWPRKDAQAPQPRTNTTPPQREESPERRQCRFHIRLFGAVWGAQPPTYSPRKNSQCQCDCAKTHKRRAASPVPRSRVPGNPVEIAIKKRPNPK